VNETEKDGEIITVTVQCDGETETKEYVCSDCLTVKVNDVVVSITHVILGLDPSKPVLWRF